MRNEWSTIRIQHKVPGSMLNKKLAVGIPVTEETAGGKLTKTVKNMWINIYVCPQVAKAIIINKSL